MFCTFCNKDYPDNRMKNHITECPTCEAKAFHQVTEEVSQCAVCGVIVRPKPLKETPEPNVELVEEPVLEKPSAPEFNRKL